MADTRLILPTEHQMRAAIAARNGDYDGTFWYGVVTTGVFCRPSCAARAARPEHIRFFFDPQHAIDAGLRPCKRCRPLEADEQTGKLAAAADYILEHADERLALIDLATRAGMTATRFQKAFKARFGVSPKALQDAARLKTFKTTLRDGASITDAIYNAGFGSSSRVYGEALRNIGMTPQAYRAGAAGETISYASKMTALGLLMMAATDRGVCFAQFGQSEPELLTRLGDEFPKARLVVSGAQGSQALDQWIRALDAHLSRDAPRPDVPLDLQGTAFQIKVWRYLLGVTEGDVISYTELADGLKRPNAVRAAASACAANKVAVLIPCHRVLRSNGDLAGYRWGLERKRVLLDKERSKTRQ